jgi:hypothetical protein
MLVTDRLSNFNTEGSDTFCLVASLCPGWFIPQRQCRELPNPSRSLARVLSSLSSTRRSLAVLLLVLVTATACSQPTPDPTPAPGVANDPVGLLGSWKVTPIDYYPDEAELTLKADGGLTVSDWCHGDWKGSWTVAGRSAISLGIESSNGDQERGPCRGMAQWMADTQMYQIVDDTHVLFRRGDNPQTASLERTAYPESTDIPTAWSAQPELPDGYRPAHEDSLQSDVWLIDGVPVDFHPVGAASRRWNTGDCPANFGSWSLSRYGYFAPNQSGVVPTIWCPPSPLILNAVDTSIKNTVRMGMRERAREVVAADGTILQAEIKESTLAMVTADGTTTIERAVRPEDSQNPEFPNG